MDNDYNKNMHGIELRPRVDPEQEGEVDPNL